MNTPAENAKHFPNDPLDKLLRAARDARYALMARKRHGAAGDWLLDHAAEKLTRALEDFPKMPRPGQFEVVGEYNSDLGYAITESEFFSQ